jgi:RNA polymerase subunit RPABC4/transcription elongation factor Spt4
MQEKNNKKRCRNCLYDVDKKIRRCPYCGILNPTVELKDIFLTTAIIIIVMFVYTTFIH